MASAGAWAYNVVWSRSPQRGSGAEPLVRRPGGFCFWTLDRPVELVRYIQTIWHVRAWFSIAAALPIALYKKYWCKIASIFGGKYCCAIARSEVIDMHAHANFYQLKLIGIKQHGNMGKNFIASLIIRLLKLHHNTDVNINSAFTMAGMHEIAALFVCSAAMLSLSIAVSLPSALSRR